MDEPPCCVLLLTRGVCGTVGRCVCVCVGVFCVFAVCRNAGRVFLVELSQKETGWCGHLRVGLTRLCPGGSDGLGCPVGTAEQSGTRQCTHSRHGMHGPALPIPVPPHASPEMEALGGTWVVPISTGLGAQREADALLGESDGEGGDIVKVGNHVIVRDSLVGRSRVGRYSHLLDPLFKTHILSTTARGTRIGVIWRILEGKYGDTERRRHAPAREWPGSRRLCARDPHTHPHLRGGGRVRMHPRRHSPARGVRRSIPANHLPTDDPKVDREQTRNLPSGSARSTPMLLPGMIIFNNHK
uniref:Neuralized-like protein 2 isoform X3 n=1 Tax=Petromyzon marinus TaxID=7757 RepID=A0AAJ7SRX2_PETMA|nr:neuralized-like protein 2 isoform X3 [Petromyzon marinus]